MFVKVAKLGGAVVEVCLEDGATVEDALEAAGYDDDGCQIRVNGRSECGTLRDKDIITLVPEIKGGRR